MNQFNSDGLGEFFRDNMKILTLAGMAIMLVLLSLAGFLTFKAFASPTAPLGGMLFESTPTHVVAVPSPTKSPSPKPTLSTTTPTPSCPSFNKWTEKSPDWSVSNGTLSNDGKGSSKVNDGPTIVAPCQLLKPDYAIEVKIQVTPGSTGSFFGIAVRAAKPADAWQGDVAYIDVSNSEANLSILNGATLANAPLALDAKVHTYRVEVRGTTIIFSIDGKQLAAGVDTKNTSPGEVGLWCSGVQLKVSSFQVTML